MGAIKKRKTETHSIGRNSTEQKVRPEGNARKELHITSKNRGENNMSKPSENFLTQLNGFSELKADAIFEPIRKLNTLAAESAEEIVDIQIKAVESNSKTYVQLLKEASTISDADSLNSYLSKQVEIARQMLESNWTVGQSIMEHSYNFINNAQETMAGAIKQKAR